MDRNSTHEVSAAERGFRVSNESESVWVRLAPLGNGTRLEIRSERTGEIVRLDAVALAAFSRLPSDVIEEIIRTSTEQS